MRCTVVYISFLHPILRSYRPNKFIRPVKAIKSPRFFLFVNIFEKLTCVIGFLALVNQMQLFSNYLNPVGSSTVKLAVSNKWNSLMELDTMWLSLTCWISVSYPTISGIIHYSGVLAQGLPLFSPWKGMIFVSRLSSILGHTTLPWISQCEYSPSLSKFKKPHHCNAKRRSPSGPHLNIKPSSPGLGIPHFKNEMYNGTPYTGKTCLYWQRVCIKPLVTYMGSPLTSDKCPLLASWSLYIVTSVDNRY